MEVIDNDLISDDMDDVSVIPDTLDRDLLCPHGQSSNGVAGSGGV